MLAGKVISAVASSVVSSAVSAGAHPIIELVKQSETASNLADSFKSALKSIGEVAGIAKSSHSLDKKRFDKIAEALKNNFFEATIGSNNPIKQLGSYIGVDGTPVKQYFAEILPETISQKFIYKINDKEEEINLLKLVCEIGRKAYIDSSKLDKENVAKALKGYIEMLVFKGIEVDSNYINNGIENFLHTLGSDIDKPELGFDIMDFIVQYKMLQSDLDLSKIEASLRQVTLSREEAARKFEEMQQQLALAQKALSVATGLEKQEETKYNQKKIEKYFLDVRKDFRDLEHLYAGLAKYQQRKKELDAELLVHQERYKSKKSDENKADTDALKKAYKQDLESLTSQISRTNNEIAKADATIAEFSAAASTKASEISRKLQEFNNLKRGLGKKALPNEAERLMQFITETRSTNAAGFFNGVSLFLKNAENYHIVLSDIKTGKPANYLLNTILANKDYGLVFDFLVNGAEVSVKGLKGQLPLHVIAGNMVDKETTRLGQIIADLYPAALITKDDTGKTPLELAERSEINADLLASWESRIEMLQKREIIEASGRG